MDNFLSLIEGVIVGLFSYILSSFYMTVLDFFSGRFFSGIYSYCILLKVPDFFLSRIVILRDEAVFKTDYFLVVFDPEMLVKVIDFLFGISPLELH